MRVREKEERLGCGVDGKCNFTNCCGVTAGESSQQQGPAGPARSTKTSTSTLSEKTFTLALRPVGGQKTTGSTGPIEIQGPECQDKRVR